ncbi:hypothetical protein [Thermus thermophilus]|uniref:hypothetical protein n=1 Tax=Thermus thermophilus TaxID=274 RepID=UPI001FCD9C05|nr:hypothetical protein [Thermus thermophilus]
MTCWLCVPEPGMDQGSFWKVRVMPLGALWLRSTFPEKFWESRVRVVVPLAPCCTFRVAGFRERLKSGVV